MPILTAEERVGGTIGGRYRIESILGEGGTSTVYRALHTFTNRRVAVKLLKPQYARDPEVVSRFLQEARVASTVVHPHVVAVLDMGTDEDCTYLVMELLVGESLAARLGRVRSLPVEEAITLLRPLLEAVAVAHDKGIVHRDIKPENVLLGDRGDGVERAVLLDFGMAKTTEAAWGHMTQSGVLVGTPYYMSPEQAEGASDLGPSTDVWSMGVLLYRVLSGELPFTGNSPTSLLLAIARGEHVRLEDRAPEVPRPIAAWVESALVTDRARRLPTMRAMLAGLDAAQQGLSPDVSTSGVVRIAPAPLPSRAPIFAGLAASLALLVGVALYVLGMDTPAAEPSAPVSATEPTGIAVEAPPPTEVPAEGPTEPPTEALAEAPPAEAPPAEDPAEAVGRTPPERSERRPREAPVEGAAAPSTPHAEPLAGSSGAGSSGAGSSGAGSSGAGSSGAGSSGAGSSGAGSSGSSGAGSSVPAAGGGATTGLVTEW